MKPCRNILFSFLRHKFKQLFLGERFEAHGEKFGYREGEKELESAPIGDYNHDVDENYRSDDDVVDKAVNIPRARIVQNDIAPMLSHHDIVCNLGRKCDHTGKAETMPDNCRDKHLMSDAIGRVCNNGKAGQY